MTMMALIILTGAISQFPNPLPEDWHPFWMNKTTYQYSNCTGEFTVDVNQTVGVFIGNPYPYRTCCEREQLLMYPLIIGQCDGTGVIYTCHSDWIPPHPSPHSDSQTDWNEADVYILIGVVTVVLIVGWLLYDCRDRIYQGYEVIDDSDPVIRVVNG